MTCPDHYHGKGGTPKCQYCPENDKTRDMFARVRMTDYQFIKDQCAIDGSNMQEVVGQIISSWVQSAQRHIPAPSGKWEKCTL